MQLQLRRPELEERRLRMEERKMLAEGEDRREQRRIQAEAEARQHELTLRRLELQTGRVPICRKLAAADIPISVAQTLSFVTTSNSCSFASCHSLWGSVYFGVKIFRDTGSNTDSHISVYGGKNNGHVTWRIKVQRLCTTIVRNLDTPSLSAVSVWPS